MLEGEMNYGSTWRMAFWAFLHLRMRVCYRVLVSITLKKKNHTANKHNLPTERHRL